MRRIAAGVALALMLTLPTPSASGTEAQPVVDVPGAIPSDCSVDVSSELASFLNGLPNGATVAFKPSGCYRVETQIDVQPKDRITVRGQGATLRRTKVSPPERRYPNSNAFLRLVRWTNSDISGLNISGLNLVSDEVALRPVYGAWDQSQEFDAGINIRGADNVVVHDLTIDGVFGDGIQIQRYGIQAHHVTIRNVTISHNGRQAISINSGDGILIDHVTIVGSRRAGIDLEPDTTNMVAQNVEIKNSSITSWLIAFSALGRGLVNHINIHDNTVFRTGVPFVKSRSVNGLHRDDWRVVNNTVNWRLGSTQAALTFDNTTNVVVDGNKLTLQTKQSRRAVEFAAGSTGVVSNNWFKGALPYPDYVLAPRAAWKGGNNSVTDTPPSAVRWELPVPPVVTPTPSPGPGVPPVVTPTPRKSTKVSLDVREPAHLGRVLRMRGRLLAAATPTFRPVAATQVRIQFRRSGQRGWVTKLVVTTGSRGWFSAGSRLKARRSGDWRAVFTGDAQHLRSTSRRDAVRVLR